MATPPGAEHRDVQQRFRDVEQQLRNLSTTILRRQPIDSVVVQYDLNSTDLPLGNFTEITVARQTITVPDGYTRAQVQLFVNAGATITNAAGGSIGVQPRVAAAGGPPISNGVSGPSPVSVGSFMARNLFNLDQIPTFDLRLFAYVNTTTVSGSGNAHLSAGVTFLR